MPTSLGMPVYPCWLGTPPGMSSQDKAIWDRFRLKYCKSWIMCYYNCHVGPGSRPPEGSTLDEIFMWYCLTTLRIDAIVETADELMIIEVRPNAGRSALGAVIVYTQLWEQDPRIQKKAVPTIVSQNITEQYKAIYTANNIRFFEV